MYNSEVDGTQIKIRFITNLDSKYNSWFFPKYLCKVPEVGEYIETNDGNLKVSSICHCNTVSGNPYLKIELTR